MRTAAPQLAGERVAAFATIRWGVGGTEAVAEVDVVNGTVVSLVASGVRVIVANEGGGGVVVAGRTLPELYIGAFASDLPRGGFSVPQRTVIPTGDAINAGANFVFPVPAFARRVRFWRTPNDPAVNTPYTLDFLLDVGGAAIEYTVNVPGLVDPVPLDIAGDIRAIRMNNIGAQNMTGVRAVFEIGL